jgi:hypothetical protein
MTNKLRGRHHVCGHAVALFAWLVSGCVFGGELRQSNPMLLPPLPPGTSIDMSLPYFREWPNGRPALFKIKDKLILAIPPQYQKFWYQGDKVVRAPAPVSQIKQVPSIGFEFFMPGFSGYTPQNYQIEFDERRVDVIEVQPADPAQMAPDAPGEYPPNMLKRVLGSILDPNDYQDLYGLRCYRYFPGFHTDQTVCYGKRDPTNGEDIMLDVTVPPYQISTRFPNMQARYFSQRFGGLRIVWRTHASNLSRWHDIDAQIWQFIAAWNVADSKSPNILIR